MATKIVFSVEFNGTQVFTSDNDVQAVGFALGLHQNSNVAHNIRVINPEGVSVTILTLA